MLLWYFLTAKSPDCTFLEKNERICPRRKHNAAGDAGSTAGSALDKDREKDDFAVKICVWVGPEAYPIVKTKMSEN
jgi:hypothetical protein